MEVLLHGVGEKQREAMMAPTPDKGDRVDEDFTLARHEQQKVAALVRSRPCALMHERKEKAAW